MREDEKMICLIKKYTPEKNIFWKNEVFNKAKEVLYNCKKIQEKG